MWDSTESPELFPLRLPPGHQGLEKEGLHYCSW